MSTSDDPTSERPASSAFVTFDDDLAAFIPPATSSAREFQSLVERNPWPALITSFVLGLVIGKLLR